MIEFIKNFINEERSVIFKMKKTDRKPEVPFIAALCAGIPLLFAYFTNRIDMAMPLALSAFIFLYLPSRTTVANKLVTILICAFGFSVAFLVGLLSSFNPWVHALSIGVLAFIVHWINSTFNRVPPGSFFFIMIATMAGAVPFNLISIPEKMGYMSIGITFVCLVGLLYAIFKQDNPLEKKEKIELTATQKSENVVDSLLIGFFIFLSMLVGKIFDFHNSYWVAISCLAVMQGFSIYHIWQRGIYRLIGTLLGVGFCWLLLQFLNSPLQVIFCIIILQYIVEVLIVRHYALAVIFITPLTILLGEIGKDSLEHVNHLMYIRFIDISVGCLIGVLGGFIIYNNSVRNITRKIVTKQ